MFTHETLESRRLLSVNLAFDPVNGLLDVNVVIDIARYVAASVPGAQLMIEPEAAHLFGFGNPDGLMQQAVGP